MTSKSSISLTPTTDGNKVFVFYANDYTDENQSQSNMIQRIFESGSLSSETTIYGSYANELFPFAICDVSGNVHLAYNGGSLNYRKRNTSGTWGEPVTLGGLDQDFAFTEGNASVVIDNDNNIHVTWFDGVNDSQRKIYYRKYISATSSWENAYIIEEGLDTAPPALPTICVDKNNDVWVFFCHQYTTYYSIDYRKRTASGWSGISSLTSGGGEGRSPAATIDKDNNVHLVWSNNTDGNWNVYYKKFDAVPFTPTNATLTNYEGSPRIQWTLSTSQDVSNYKVYRNGNLIHTTASASTTSFVDYSILIGSGQQFTYYVKANDAISQLSNASNSVNTTGNFFKNGGTTTGTTDKFTYHLYGNYPNPFNPTTIIAYSIENPEMVTLSVYNFIGQEVAQLIKKEQQPGNYSITWDASGLPSGIYLAKIKAGSFTQTQKMNLTK